jgi:hypothetical protein
MEYQNRDGKSYYEANTLPVTHYTLPLLRVAE